MRVGCNGLGEQANLRGRRSGAPQRVQSSRGGRCTEVVAVGGCGTTGEGLGWVKKKAGETSVHGDCYSVGGIFSQVLFVLAMLSHRVDLRKDIHMCLEHDLIRCAFFQVGSFLGLRKQ